MFDKLEFTQTKYRELSEKISDPEIISDQPRWTALMKEHASLTPIVEKYTEYKKSKEQIEENREILNDSGIDREFEEMVKEEIKELETRIGDLEKELKVLLLPKDPNDDKNVILEIRGGVGGEEAALFAADLFRMYSMYASRVGWKMEVLSVNETENGGLKEIVAMVNGQGAYSKLKFETGVHRVQRVPETESSGRIHTSAATVAVLPEVQDVEVDINPNDIRIDVFRAGGHGGQCVNTTDSAVRITHLPTGITVSCQDEKSQLKNKEKGMVVLRSRLYDKLKSEQDKEVSDERKSQVGSGDRSERIRTYNYPQGRVTDHRIGLTLYRLDAIMNGDIQEIIDSLITYYQSEKMKTEGLS